MVVVLKRETTMTFRITGLPAEPFRPMFRMTSEELAMRGALRQRVSEHPGFPCRISLTDAPIGDEVLLVNFEHQPCETPYRSRHAIFVARSSTETYDRVDTVPEQLRSRLLSVRAFDAGDMMVDADVVGGSDVEATIERMLQESLTSYLHVHFAKRGCYAARVERG
jgi:hypothetical protein